MKVGSDDDIDILRIAQQLSIQNEIPPNSFALRSSNVSLLLSHL